MIEPSCCSACGWAMWSNDWQRLHRGWFEHIEECLDRKREALSAAAERGYKMLVTAWLLFADDHSTR